jgi:hypothetical protein
MFKVEAAPPRESVATVVLNTVAAVALLVVISALVVPFTPKSPAMFVSFCSSTVPKGLTTMLPEAAVVKVKLPLVFVQPEAPPEAKVKTPVELPMLVAAVPLALMLAVPIDVNVVNAPVLADVAPMAVELMPVAVVLK